MGQGESRAKEGAAPEASAGAGKPEYRCKWYGCLLEPTGEVRRPLWREHFLGRDGQTGNRAAFDFERDEHPILRHVGEPTDRCKRNGSPEAPSLPSPSTGAEAPKESTTLAKAHMRGLLNRLEDGYYAYETATSKSLEEAEGREEWQAAKKEIMGIYGDLLAALEAYTEWRRLRSWAMGADDAESWRKAHEAESNFHAKAETALSKARAEARKAVTP